MDELPPRWPLYAARIGAAVLIALGVWNLSGLQQPARESKPSQDDRRRETAEAAPALPPPAAAPLPQAAAERAPAPPPRRAQSAEAAALEAQPKAPAQGKPAPAQPEAKLQAARSKPEAKPEPEPEPKPKPVPEPETVSASQADSPPPAVADAAAVEWAAMLAAHNRWRGQAGVPELDWSLDAATAAQARADELAQEGCAIDAEPAATPPQENLLRVSGFGSYDGWKTVPAEVVDRWAATGRQRNPANGSCRAGQHCTQYDQVVNPNARFVGCGRARCQAAEVWVCNYVANGPAPG